MLTSGVVAKRTIKKFLKNSPNGPVWWYAGKKDLQQGVVWRLFFLVPSKSDKWSPESRFPPELWFRPSVNPVSKCFLVRWFYPKKVVKVRIHPLCTANETLRCDPVSLMWKCSCLDSSWKNINQNEFHLPQFSGWKWKKTIWSHHPVCCFSQTPDLVFPFMLSEPAVKIGKTTAYEIFLQPVIDIVKAHGNHNSKHQRWDQTQIGALVHQVPVAKRNERNRMCLLKCDS